MVRFERCEEVEWRRHVYMGRGGGELDLEALTWAADAERCHLLSRTHRKEEAGCLGRRCCGLFRTCMLNG